MYVLVHTSHYSRLEKPTLLPFATQEDYHVYDIARSTCHHAYARQTQVSIGKNESKKIKEDKGKENERKDKKAKKRKANLEKKTQGKQEKARQEEEASKGKEKKASY